MTDPIADMLTRIRNANQMKHESVIIPASNFKKAILDVIKKEGFIEKVEIMKKTKKDKTAGTNLKVYLKYSETRDKERVIKGLKRISKPGLRVYAKVDELPRVFNGLGVALISTPNGVLTDRDARKQSVGGEVLAYIW